MIITNSSLTQVSKELIDKRVYQNGTITIVGNPVIADGTATNLSSSNYFTSTNFSFDEILRNVKINFSGTYSPNDTTTTSCAWELQPSKLSLNIKDNKIYVQNNGMTIVSFDNLPFNIESHLESSIIFSNTYNDANNLQQSCSATLIFNGETYNKVVTVGTPIDFSTFISLTLGNSSDTNSPWQGNLYLADFALYQNGTIIYTPSARNSFKFTKIMIGDGTTPLTDNSVPILDHVYKIPIYEVSRTNNNVLLTCTIPADAYLTIAELALYYEDDTGTHIFSKISGLSVAKGRDLIYNLVMHVKIDINVVNTIAVPEIVIKDEEYIKYTDFLTVKQVYAYITENMERLIRLNALGIGSYDNSSMQMQKAPGIGFNKPQILYRAENNLALCLDECAATTSYSKLKNKLSPRTTVTFDPTLLEVVGNAVLTDKGIGSAFSVSSYIKSVSPFSPSQVTNWTITIPFHTGTATGDRTIINLGGDFIKQPLVLSNGNYCKLILNGVDTIIVQLTDSGTTTNLTYQRSSTVTINNTTYYSWVTSDSVSYPTILTTVYKNLTSSTPIYDNTGTQISAMTFFAVANTEIYNGNLFHVTSDTDYIVVLEYTPGLYKATWKDSNGIVLGTKEIPSGLKLGNIENTYFGIQYNGSDTFVNPFNGIINFMYTSFHTETYSDSIELLNESTITYQKHTKTKLSLGDYFHIPDYSHHYYHVQNLGFDGTSYLEVYEGAFKGYYDRIDFLTNPNGFTMCAKVFLANAKDKILLAKGNIETDSYYFILEEKDQALIFTMYLPSGTVIMRKDFTTQDIRSYIEHPILLTITCNGNQYSPTFKMYKNNELLSTYVLPNFSNIGLNNMYLMNHEHFTSDEELKEHTVHDILGISGEISSEDLYYITNMLDTNF